MIRARILPHHDDEVALAEIVVGDGGFADPDHLVQRETGRFVAHIRAVGEVVGAECPHEELVDERRLVGCPSAGVKGRLIRCGKAVELARDDVERGLPRYRDVVVGSLRAMHRIGEPTEQAELVFGNGEHVVDRVLGEETQGNGDRGRLPGDGLCAVFAELGRAAVIRVRPGAAHAIEPALLVHGCHELGGAQRSHLTDGGPHRVEDGRNAHGPGLPVTDLELGICAGVAGVAGCHSATTVSLIVSSVSISSTIRSSRE